MITVSLETAKKLQKAGWGKRTYFYYCYSKKGGVFKLAKVSPTSCVGIFAPTAQEILDELPENIDNQRYLVIDKENIQYEQYDDRIIKFSNEGNLSEPLAYMRLRCKENGYLPSKTDE